MGCRCGKGDRMGRDSSDDESSRAVEDISEYNVKSSESSFYTADEELQRQTSQDNDIREYKKKLMWNHPHRDPEQAFRARAHEAISDVNRKRDKGKDGDVDQDSSFRECFYVNEYNYPWRDCMLLFFYLMEHNLINPPTVTITRAPTKHGNEFNYKLDTALPWMLAKIIDLESVGFYERGHLDTETSITAYTLHNVTSKTGGCYHITEYCEYQGIGESQTTFRKMVKTECPDWIPDFAIDKACDIYIKSTEKRCKKNAVELAKGVANLQKEATPTLLAEIQRLGLGSFEAPASAAVGALPGAIGEGHSNPRSTQPRSRNGSGGSTGPRHLRRDSRGDLEEFSTPRHGGLATPKHSRSWSNDRGMKRVTPRNSTAPAVAQ